MIECPHCHKMVDKLINHIPKEHDYIFYRGKWIEKNERPSETEETGMS